MFPAQDRHWRRLFAEQANRGALVWVGVDPDQQIPPGGSRDGFDLEASYSPGLAPYWIQGFTPVPKVPFGAEPDSVAGGSLFENSVSDTTIGPAVEPADADEPSEILGQMEELLVFSCRRGWIDNRGICTSLEQKLRGVRQSVDRGRTDAARGRLRAFREELEAQRDRHVNASAFTSLAFYADRLCDRL